MGVGVGVGGVGVGGTGGGGGVSGTGGGVSGGGGSLGGGGGGGRSVDGLVGAVSGASGLPLATEGADCWDDDVVVEGGWSLVADANVTATSSESVGSIPVGAGGCSRKNAASSSKCTRIETTINVGRSKRRRLEGRGASGWLGRALTCPGSSGGGGCGTEGP